MKPVVSGRAKLLLSRVTSHRTTDLQFVVTQSTVFCECTASGANPGMAYIRVAPGVTS